MRSIVNTIIISFIFFLPIELIAQAPVFMNDTVSWKEDSTGSVFVLGNDYDPEGDLFRVSSIVKQPKTGFALVAAAPLYANHIEFFAFSNFNGADSIGYRVCDSNVNCADTAWVLFDVIAVNDAPYVVDDVYNCFEDSVLLAQPIINDIDVDGDSSTWVMTLVGNPSNGLAVVSNDTFLYVPYADWYGEDSVQYAVCDTALCDTAWIYINVIGRNDAPIANRDTALTDEDNDVQVDVLANDTELDGDSMFVTILQQGNNGFATLLSDNIIEYIPASNWFGIDTITYSACDIHLACDSDTLIMLVDPVNDRPVAIDDTIQIMEESTVNVCVQANDFDIEKDILTTKIVFTPTEISAAIIADDSIRITAGLNFVGITSMTYSICDGTLCDTATVLITVNNVNDTPVAVNDTLSAYEDSLTVLDITANDFDLEGDSLILNWLSSPLHGTAQMVDMEFAYKSDLNYNGADTIIYCICDIYNACDTAEIFLNILAVNDPPNAVRDLIISTDSFNVIPAKSNDFDVDGDAIDILFVESPMFGVSVIVGEDFQYHAMHGFNGVDSFRYQVCDPSGLCDTAWIVLELETNERPIAIDDSYEFNEGENMLMLVQSNDSDPDGDPLITTILGFAEQGFLMEEQNAIRYESNTKHSVLERFEYEVCDDGTPVLCDTAEVLLAVKAEYLFPQGFSPNGDGVNDQLEVKGLDSYRLYTLSVFDRTGKRVFSTKEFIQTWDGKDESGRELSSGTYYYKLESDGIDPQSGFVIIKK